MKIEMCDKMFYNRSLKIWKETKMCNYECIEETNGHIVWECGNAASQKHSHDIRTERNRSEETGHYTIFLQYDNVFYV
jgi:hypothetical protein